MHFYMLLSQLLSVSLYFGSMYLFTSVINVAYIDFNFFQRIMLVTMASWLPLHILRILKSKFYPNDYEKIMANYRKSRREIIHDI